MRDEVQKPSNSEQDFVIYLHVLQIYKLYPHFLKPLIYNDHIICLSCNIQGIKLDVLVF